MNYALLFRVSTHAARSLCVQSIDSYQCMLCLFGNLFYKFCVNYFDTGQGCWTSYFVHSIFIDSCEIYYNAFCNKSHFVINFINK